MAEETKKETEATDKVENAEATDKVENATGAATATTDKTEEVKEEKVELYDEVLPNRIIVGRNHPLSFYVDRARRVFRIEEQVYIQGRGDNIATTCKLIEALKRQKIAEITKISTGMNVEPYFNSYGDAKWGQPTAIILFTLKRGEFGKFIADYQQRKIIEIFENTDKDSSGVLSFDQVDGLKFDARFKSNQEQIKESKEFLSGFADKKELDLPGFIKFASILIHPLLKAKIFKDILSNDFGIEVSGGNRNNDD
mmetsp:Transcript_19050/g.16923  ORF Transcript_19050/g.16923 Transcript_19050/m.16923 type:complete len:254 (-) Transcript_19050:94-855(-)|eukprot:CAMPEP_0201594060 /NCGR_PEP_ID=MMETSP0190_2-20130828/191491_1 /ASSEMBLY_ACC=CAM_ASM_000263 /TAXON_ID=37353 /ORGANISM="Rosalina sp." /LENGTH=253 /DNA_ID=CAMNT_0048053525 /DNA_START=460 /DNA_END=1221 /DNA_ORIENTATION=+